jgi:acyl dehydratase
VSSDTVYLEDLTPGRRFETGRVTVTAEDIKAFAASFDPQPFHLDEALARDSVFGGLAASGWHTAALTMRLLVTGQLRVAGGLVGLGADVSWPRATRPGDELRVVSEVLEARPSKSNPARGIATIRHETLTQRSEVVQTCVVKILVPTRPVD